MCSLLGTTRLLLLMIAFDQRYIMLQLIILINEVDLLIDLYTRYTHQVAMPLHVLPVYYRITGAAFMLRDRFDSTRP